MMFSLSKTWGVLGIWGLCKLSGCSTSPSLPDVSLALLLLRVLPRAALMHQLLNPVLSTWHVSNLASMQQQIILISLSRDQVQRSRVTCLRSHTC